MANWTFSSDEAVRDYLAGQALVGLVARAEKSETPDDAELAEQAYALADAMMEARKPTEDRR